ncbi:T9SS type A sorting domain-containing protein [Niastella sp. OAS944]|uniref:T9SS type A sorting domain-containing protein n=1 Tax=Niastella sp. OAS944 TaxID=2664089 RepID=UPI00346DD4A0|nr:hypothetical protein [Chitinophagaceae bacterium OAS944]
MYPVPDNCGKGAAMLLLSLSLVSLQPGRAQCIAVGPKSPATSANVSYSGSDYAFHNPSNALVNDNNFAYAASLASIFNKTTDYLQVKDFGFNIPTAATICNIEAKVVKSATDIDLLIISAWVKDYDVRIIKNNVLAGNNQKNSAAWNDAPTAVTYGGSDPLWGTTWSPAEVNNSNFGLSIAAEVKTGIGLLPVINIDNISLTVYYLDPSVLPAQVVQFNVAHGSNNTALVSWKQSSGDAATSFIVERSVNGSTWESLPGNVQKNNTASLFKDNRPLPGKSYYRLKMINAVGNAHYTTTLPFELTDVTSLTCYPNPFTSVIQVKGLEAGEQVAVSNLLGQRIFLSTPAATNTLSININDLQPGMYVISAGNRKMKVEKR